MTKREKRLEKVRQNPKHASKDVLDQILSDYGFVRREGKGSHTVYQHPGQETPIVVAAHGKHVPAYIVKQVLDAIDHVIEQEKSDDPEDS
jgi:predicted RNA binding protein YcfA (HicA-like mRNA interferase family)